MTVRRLIFLNVHSLASCGIVMMNCAETGKRYFRQAAPGEHGRKKRKKN